LRLFAVAAPGLELVVASEVACLEGARALSPTVGGVEFEGGLKTLYRANLSLRVATRVLLRLGEVKARDFAKLRKGAAELPWEEHIGGPCTVEIAATAHRSRLYHTGGIAERIEGAIRDRLGSRAILDAGPALGVVVRGEGDVFTISVDSSGELLHRRGWREEALGAPLRETLAAGALALAGWNPRTALCDPTCGSGTIAIEAALLALRRAPGMRRSFAFQGWPGFDAKIWTALLTEAAARERKKSPPVVGWDIDPAAIALARRNARRAGVADRVRFETSDVASARLPEGPGVILANPPYGKRMSPPQLENVYLGLGRLARSAGGWRLAILTSEPRLAALAGRPIASHALVNGGVKIALYLMESGS
jgi:23S rRNA G2445 N2-methylase RlmL